MATETLGHDRLLDLVDTMLNYGHNRFCPRCLKTMNKEFCHCDKKTPSKQNQKEGLK